MIVCETAIGNADFLELKPLWNPWTTKQAICCPIRERTLFIVSSPFHVLACSFCKFQLEGTWKRVILCFSGANSGWSLLVFCGLRWQTIYINLSRATRLGYDFVLRMTWNEFYFQQANAWCLTHKLTHNRKRAGGGNGAESTIASYFPEQKGPQSTGKRYS